MKQHVLQTVRLFSLDIPHKFHSTGQSTNTRYRFSNVLCWVRKNNGKFQNPHFCMVSFRKERKNAAGLPGKVMWCENSACLFLT